MRPTQKHNAQALLTMAQRGRYAIGAFNVSELLTLQAIVRAAVKLRAPVIIETSPGETAFIGAPLETAMLRSLEQEFGVPILCNLDHAVTVAATRTAMQAGYDLIHFDGSKLSVPANIRLTKRVASAAHARHLLVEGERDHITGSSELHSGTVRKEQKKEWYTNPDEAREFVRETGVDIFAAFIGNVHGVFQDDERLDIARLKKIHSAVPAFLSLHGGSGIRATDVRKAIGAGIVKVNVNTELRIAFIASLRKALQNKREVAPYKLFGPVVAAVQKVVEEKIRLFGSAGKA